VSELRKQNAAYQNKVRQCEEILFANGLAFPPHDNHAQASSSLATISLVGDIFDTQKIQAYLPSTEPTITRPTVEQRGTLTAWNYRTDTGVIESSNSDTSTSHVSNDSTWTPIISSKSLDTPQIAINFILALEKPCLHHQNVPCLELQGTKIGEVDIDSGATGHMHMLSGPIMKHSPYAANIDPFTAYPSDTEWTVPTAELENLLRFSEKLGLIDDEVTPVQAWQVITQHKKFGLLEEGDLARLRDALLPLVKCYG
jgi:hypothetical protein